MLRDVTATLKKVSALRDLCLKLPHLATELEEKRLRRFDALVASTRDVTTDDVAAIVTGWRRWWREGHIDAICDMASRLPPGLVENDRDLAMYAMAAAVRREAR